MQVIKYQQFVYSGYRYSFLCNANYRTPIVRQIERITEAQQNFRIYAPQPHENSMLVHSSLPLLNKLLSVYQLAVFQMFGTMLRCSLSCTALQLLYYTTPVHGSVLLNSGLHFLPVTSWFPQESIVIIISVVN